MFSEYETIWIKEFTTATKKIFGNINSDRCGISTWGDITGI